MLALNIGEIFFWRYSHILQTSIKGNALRFYSSQLQDATSLKNITMEDNHKKKISSKHRRKNNFVDAVEVKTEQIKQVPKIEKSFKLLTTLDNTENLPIHLGGMSDIAFEKLPSAAQIDCLYCINLSPTIKLNGEQHTKFVSNVKKFIAELSNSHHLHTYFQSCIDTGNIGILEEYVFKNSRLHKDPKPYILLLNEICKTHNFDLFQKICEVLTMKDVQFDAHLLALLFQCLGTFDKNPEYTFEKTKYFIDIMNAKNIGMKQVIAEGSIYKNNYNYVSLAISKIDGSLLDLEPMVDISDRYNCRILKPLNGSLSKANVDSPLYNVMTKEELENAYKKQIKIEKADIIEVNSVHSFTKALNKPEDDKLLAAWKLQWRNQITSAIKHHKEFLHSSFFSTDSRSNIHSLYPYFNILDDEEYVDTMCNVVDDVMFQSSQYYAPHFFSIALDIGEDILKKYNIKYRSLTDLERFSKVYMKLCDWYLDHSANGGGYNPTLKFETLLNEENLLKSSQASDRNFTFRVIKNLGETMLNLMLNNITIPVTINGEIMERPAFLKVMQSSADRLCYEVRPCPELLELICESKLLLRSSTMPMLCPPLPWLSYAYGGYFLNRIKLVRSEISAQQLQLLTSDSKKIQPILDGLTQIGSIPWKINKAVLDVLLQVFQNGGSNELNIPLGIPDFAASLPSANGIKNAQQRVSILIDNAKKTREHYALWRECLLKLSVCEHYRNEIIWLPQSIDFRGRVYPTVPHLSPVSCDKYRALLVFGKGKRLGPDGLRWLKIHVINLAGKHKLHVLSEKLQYCEDNLDLIFDSADNPLDGKKWWTEAGDQWQCLAACKELTNALRSKSPEDYISHLPIHQDGSCNGLQHYAALGRDRKGAVAVNVKPSERPQDVYTEVLNIIKKQIELDVRSNNEKLANSAKIISPLLERKIVKQTIMTSVYGVTTYGALLQIKKQLMDKITDDADRNLASSYLTKLTFDALKTMFTNAKKIQNWFQHYASFISRNYRREVFWYTPLGLPVIQPYIKTPITFRERNRKMNILKQSNAFPPNYIHSLDSTHMFLTALHCGEGGITFAAIHDCYWTHAADVDRVNKICREQFAELYSLPLLNDLKSHFDENFPTNDYMSDELSVPPIGDFDVNEVKSSTYFFS